MELILMDITPEQMELIKEAVREALKYELYMIRAIFGMQLGLLGGVFAVIISETIRNRYK